MAWTVRTGKWSRDAVLFTVSISLLVYEVTVGGARPAVLSLLTGLLLSPVLLRLDDQRRRSGNGDRNGTAHE